MTLRRGFFARLFGLGALAAIPKGVAEPLVPSSAEPLIIPTAPNELTVYGWELRDSDAVLVNPRSVIVQQICDAKILRIGIDKIIVGCHEHQGFYFAPNGDRLFYGYYDDDEKRWIKVYLRPKSGATRIVQSW